jgi:hypothetical protein
MLGDFGFRMPLDPEEGVVLVDKMQPAFLAGGKMVDPKTKRTQNTTISAIVALERFRTGDVEFHREVRRKEGLRREAVGRELSQQEREEVLKRTLEERLPRGTWVPRVIVYENPDARIPLPRDLFQGPYDERLAFEDGLIRSVFVGKALEEEREARGKS